MAVVQLTSAQLAAERWLPIPEWEGYYDASDMGRIRSLSRIVDCKNGTKMPIKGGILKVITDRDGYRMVGLHKDGKGQTKKVHRLVMLAFVGEGQAGQYVCHVNDDPTDNRLCNLRYGWPSDNAKDMVVNGGHFRMEKTECPQGHSLSGGNLVPSDWKWGHRKCLACSRAYGRLSSHEWSEERMQKESDAEYQRILVDGPSLPVRESCRRGHPLQSPNLVPSQWRVGRRTCLACQRTHTYLQKHEELKPHFNEIADSYYEAIMRKAEPPAA